MPRDDRADVARNEALDRFWDQIVQSQPGDAEELDPEAMVTIRRLHAHDDRPGPHTGFTHRLREELMHAHIHALAAASPGGLATPLGPEQPAALPRDASRPIPGFLQTALAAVLVLAILGGYLALGPGRWARRGDAPVYLPALSGTPATGATVVTETLFDVHVEGLPSGIGAAALIRWTLRPSEQAHLAPPQDGLRFFVVESGEVTVTEGETTVRLAAGQAFIAADQKQEVAFRPRGPDPAILYRGFVAKGLTAANWDPKTETWDWLVDGASVTMPGGSGGLVVERLTLPLGSSLPPLPATPLVWTAVASGILGLTLEGDQLLTDSAAAEELLLRNGSRWPTVPPGQEMVLRNAGDEPLVLYRMTLTPAS